MGAGPLLWTRTLQHGIEIMFNTKKSYDEMSSFEWFVYRTKRKIINTITSPYYKLKWFEVDLRSRSRDRHTNLIFVSWHLRDPLKINYRFRQLSVKCDLCSDGWDAMKDRTAYSYLWSKKINTIKTTYTCDTKLFGPVEAFYNSGGEEGGLMFGGGATYEK